MWMSKEANIQFGYNILNYIRRFLRRFFSQPSFPASVRFPIWALVVETVYYVFKSKQLTIVLEIYNNEKGLL